MKAMTFSNFSFLFSGSEGGAKGEGARRGQHIGPGAHVPGRSADRGA